MNDRNVLFGLHELAGVGWRTIERLVSGVSGAISGLLDAEPADLVAFGVKPNAAAAICGKLTPAFIESRLETYVRNRVSFVTEADPDYPPLLREIAQPPWVLYYRGDLSVLTRPCIAMVGTRSPTAYGRKIAFELARDLSYGGICVASGLARGIDSSAHRGALEGEGGTAAVLGCGPDRVYPIENASLYADITQKGVIVSEYPLGTEPKPGLFPQRNRIISGLSLGTVVVEAASRSGSLITADQALEQSRDVFAVPGPITSSQSSGTLDLIRQGAKLVTCAEDIMEEYRRYSTKDVPGSRADTAQDGVEASADERKLLELLSAVPITFDELLILSGIEFGHLHSVLLNLILKKKIEPLPGSAYIRL
ncbi:DNA-protecting protein DprA [Paenibacillus ginsengarvi]|uniref:DNA-protecting protein DprA n=1 Tax=Paenibacillus ginsengarvi TaxID=400777 RepID=A0A3B0CMU2_9BACL|nr:DNA-processing protein DprA [Paenibacillus ginsengarvi]RKN86995.1 DNA-protecting protein DprA [Paenibacillus ginsengarvi]